MDTGWPIAEIVSGGADGVDSVAAALADVVLAFWNGTSPGTRTLAKARAVLGDDQIALCGIGDADPDLQLIDPVDPNQ